MLRRGIIPGYANGTDNVPDASTAPPVVAATPVVPAARVPQGSRTVPQGVVPSPADIAASATGYSQLMGGQYNAALQNPQAAPATKAAAGFMNTLGSFGDYIQRAYRAQAVASPPSAVDHVINFFTGDDRSTAALAQQAKEATQLQDPLVQEYLMKHPGALDVAERDRSGFAANTQKPEFRQTMQDAVNNHAVASQGIPVTDDAGNQRIVTDHDPAVVGKAMTDHGLPATPALAATHGGQLSREEFVNAMRGTPTKILQMLFGAQLGHVPQVHDVVAKIYFDAKEQQLAQQRAEIAAMQKRNDPREASTLKQRMDALTKAEQEHVQEMGIYSGVYQRPYVMTPPPGQ